MSHAFATVLASAGALHVLVNNAGIGSVGSVVDTTVGELGALYDVNVKGTYLCLREAVKAMLKNGTQNTAASVPTASGYSSSDGVIVPQLSSSVTQASTGQQRSESTVLGGAEPPFTTPSMNRAVSAPAETNNAAKLSASLPTAAPVPESGIRLSAAAAAAAGGGGGGWGGQQAPPSPSVPTGTPATCVPAPKGGVCINISSITAQVGMSERFAYSVASGAIAAMTRSVAADYAAQGIRCNTVLPGRVHTKFMDEYLSQVCPGEEAAQLARLGAYHPLGRMAEPREVAALVAFLASDEAAFITGCEYNLDGGAAAIRQ